MILLFSFSTLHIHKMTDFWCTEMQIHSKWRSLEHCFQIHSAKAVHELVKVHISMKCWMQTKDTSEKTGNILFTLIPNQNVWEPDEELESIDLVNKDNYILKYWKFKSFKWIQPPLSSYQCVQMSRYLKFIQNIPIFLQMIKLCPCLRSDMMSILLDCILQVSNHKNVNAPSATILYTTCMFENFLPEIHIIQWHHSHLILTLNRV